MSTYNNIQEYLENEEKVQFVNKNFADFRVDLLNHAREFYGENITDFSETSLGGMFLDFAAIVGDSLVYYAEQQFNELDYKTATNDQNIVNFLKRANIKNNSSFPASVEATFTITVEKDSSSSSRDPEPIKDYLPVLKKGARLVSDSGIEFQLIEDVDFSKNYKKTIAEFNPDGSPFSLNITKKGLCNSGRIVVESVSFDQDTKNYFLSYELESENVTEIISVFDQNLNEYYEVDYLSQNTVFTSFKNEIDNNDYVYVKNAPYRFVLERDFRTKKTFLRFGNGNGKVIKDNVFANTSDLILPLKNKEVFGRTDIDPSLLLQNNSLGVSPAGKTLTITYKQGGGFSHNIRENTLNTFSSTPSLVYQNTTNLIDSQTKNSILQSLEVTNEKRAVGGAPSLTLNQLKAQIPSTLNSQSRIITHEDLIARILTMPSKFGKIEKAMALNNPYSSLAKDLYIICKDNEGFYTYASDAIKINLSNYLNEFRLISDNFNILDVPIYNFGINLQIRVRQGFDIENVLFNVQTSIDENMGFNKLQIGQPIDVNKLLKVVNNVNGIQEIITPIKNIVIPKTEKDQFYDFTNNQIRSYSNNIVDPILNYSNGLIYPAKAGIFELKYSSFDVKIDAQ